MSNETKQAVLDGEVITIIDSMFARFRGRGARKVLEIQDKSGRRRWLSVEESMRVRAVEVAS